MNTKLQEILEIEEKLNSCSKLEHEFNTKINQILPKYHGKFVIVFKPEVCLYILGCMGISNRNNLGDRTYITINFLPGALFITKTTSGFKISNLYCDASQSVYINKHDFVKNVIIIKKETMQKFIDNLKIDLEIFTDRKFYETESKVLGE